MLSHFDGGRETGKVLRFFLKKIFVYCLADLLPEPMALNCLLPQSQRLRLRKHHKNKSTCLTI